MRRLMRMVLIGILLAALIPLAGSRNAAAQGRQTSTPNQDYRSDVLGLTFQYPGDWGLHEQLATQTVTAAAKADFEAVSAGQKPDGLLFSVTLSSFRQIGVEQTGDFGPLLQKIVGTASAAPTPTRIGGADGLVIDTSDTAQDVATRTAILSVGRRRVAVLRGVATIAGWQKDGESRFNDLVSSLSFFPPADGAAADNLGKVVWQLPADKFIDLTDISIDNSDSLLYVTDRMQGIWKVGANGVAQDVSKPGEIGEFAKIGVLRDGTQYIADPANNAIWLIGVDPGKARRLLGGQVGIGRGAFGKHSPAAFAFGLQGSIYTLDDNDKGLRVQVFNRAGIPVAAWDLSKVQSTPIEAPAISSDVDGNAYVIGLNTGAIIKLSPSGQIINKQLSAGVLANSGLLSIIVDRFYNIYVATQDQGILKLNADGKLLGVIGQAYDESSPPKAGQFGKPRALAMPYQGNLLYVVDAGKYPQIVAIALDGNTAVSVKAGTQDGGAIIYGQTVKGEITAANFVYTYEFTGRAGDVVTITMRQGDGSQLDPYVDLIGPDNQRLAANDDAKAPDLGPTDAQIKAFKLPIKGTYTIRATRFGRETTTGVGAYTLSLETAQ